MVNDHLIKKEASESFVRGHGELDYGRSETGKENRDIDLR